MYSPFLFKKQQSYPEIEYQIDKMLKFLKNKENLPGDEYDSDFLIDFFHNKKLGRVIAAIMKKPPFLRQVNSHIPEKQARDLLFDIWTKTNREINGYCSQNEKKNELFRDIFVENYEFLVKKDVLSLESLYYDHSDYMRSHFYLNGVVASDIIVAYNLEVVTFLTGNSNKIKFFLNTASVPGDFYKKIFLRSRGLYLEYKITNDRVIMEINAPTGIISRNSHFKRKIKALFLYVIYRLIYHGFQAEVTIEIEYFNRKRVLTIPDITELLLLEKNEPYSTINSCKDESFDSKVEEEFFMQFRSLSSRWAIIREPEVLILADTVIIPDFVVSWAGIKIYVEIVGFWTTSYLDKKYKKLIKLKESSLKFIILVDKNLKLADTGLPTFQYSGFKYPIYDIISFLDRNYYKKRFESRKKLIIDRIIRENILSILSEEKEYLKGEDLTELLHLESNDELEVIMHDSTVQNYLNKRGLIFIRVYGLISKNNFDRMKNEVSSHLESLLSGKSDNDKEINYQDFKKSFNVDELLLVQLLKSLGYEIVWKSLINCMIKKVY